MTKGTLSPLTINSQTTKIVKPKITGTTNLTKRVSEAAEFAKTTFIRQAASQNTNAKITNVMTCPFDSALNVAPSRSRLQVQRLIAQPSVKPTKFG